MKHEPVLKHEFVEFIPDKLEYGIVYVSIPYVTVAHKCCCGCGTEVVTPLSPPDWKLIFDGETVSLDPSIGNWSFACKSHYWIRRNKVKWAPRWSQDEIDAVRSHERLAKETYTRLARKTRKLSRMKPRPVSRVRKPASRSGACGSGSGTGGGDGPKPAYP